MLVWFRFGLEKSLLVWFEFDLGKKFVWFGFQFRFGLGKKFVNLV